MENTTANRAVRFAATPPSVAPPEALRIAQYLREHCTDEVLAELGISEAELKTLREARTIV